MLIYLSQFYSLSGTALIVDGPAAAVTYTSIDNTLTIISLASSANADQLCCNWVTI
jgi:hypothetical protein